MRFEIAELPQRFAARLVGRQAAGLQLLDAHLEVDAQFLVDLGPDGVGSGGGGTRTAEASIRVAHGELALDALEHGLDRARVAPPVGRLLAQPLAPAGVSV